MHVQTADKVSEKESMEGDEVEVNAYIWLKLPITEILAGLAEECSELAQAALKFRRVCDKRNPTDKTLDEAIEDFYEEVADVRLYLDQLCLSEEYIKEIMDRKEKRWMQRLKDSSTEET